MTSQFEISEVTTRLEELFARARAGEEIVLVDQGNPVIKLGPAGGGGHDPHHDLGYGMYAGQIWIADDFDSPLPEEDLAEWEK